MQIQMEMQTSTVFESSELQIALKSYQSSKQYCPYSFCTYICCFNVWQCKLNDKKKKKTRKRNLQYILKWTFNCLFKFAIEYNDTFVLRWQKEITNIFGELDWIMGLCRKEADPSKVTVVSGEIHLYMRQFNHSFEAILKQSNLFSTNLKLPISDN